MTRGIESGGALLHRPGYAPTAVKQLLKNVARQILPWAISGAALYYVFGYAIDWEAIPEATQNAHLPLFIAIIVLDKLVFFTVWGLIQAKVIRQFLKPVPVRQIMSIKGAAELIRSVNNSLSDAAFFFGVWQLTGESLAAVVAVVFIPFVAHFVVLVIQATFSLPFLPGGIADNLDVSIIVALSWIVLLSLVVASRLGVLQRLLKMVGLEGLVGRVHMRDWIPYVGYFVLFAIFDVVIQGLASRAFGIDISWTALSARIPVLYFALMIPSFANFGTREIAWANLFSEFGPSSGLYAFALWTNVIFMSMHVLIGAVFLGGAIRLVSEMNAARRLGEKVPRPIVHDAIDP